MPKHAPGKAKVLPDEAVRVLDGEKNEETIPRVLDVYDATTLVGLRTVVYGAAIESVDEDGEVEIELPNLRGMLASAAVVRCLMPIRLRGFELKAIRRIMKLTLAELAAKLDERTAIETVSRWESEAQPMGGYVEKLMRLLVCEELHADAPGVAYKAAMIANMKVMDPWRSDEDFEVPPIHLNLILVKEQASGSIIEAWDAKEAA